MGLSTVPLLHGGLEAVLEPGVASLGGALDHLVDGLLLRRREWRQNVVGKLAALRQTVLSDHPDAKRQCMELVTQIPDMRPLDAGDLTQAAPIEAFTAVLLQLNIRYKTRVAVKFTGVDGDPFA